MEKEWLNHVTDQMMANCRDDGYYAIVWTWYDVPEYPGSKGIKWEFRLIND